MNMSEQPALALAMALLFFWLRWRRKPTIANELAIGACAGWAAIVRPIDAICFVAPIFVAMLVRRIRLEPRRLARSLLICIAGGAPFIGLQLIFDRGVTGHWLTTPVIVCLNRDLPGLSYGLGKDDVTVPPQTTLEQKIVFYRAVIRPQIERDQSGGRIRNWYRQFGPQLLTLSTPVAILILLVPLAGFSRHRLAYIAAAPIAFFLLLYPMYPFFISHYLFTLVPAAALLVVLGLDGLSQLAGRRRASVMTTLMFATLALAIGCLPQFYTI
jgi:hypothetical protein